MSAGSAEDFAGGKAITRMGYDSERQKPTWVFRRILFDNLQGLYAWAAVLRFLTTTAPLGHRPLG
jgi:hypothetical protein